MKTSEHTQNLTIKAKPTYSVVPYDLTAGKCETTTSNLAVSNEDLRYPIKTGEVSTRPVEIQKRITKKSVTEKEKLKKEDFQKALIEIYRHGLECESTNQKIRDTVLEPLTNAAIPGLAKILGTYHAYFDNVNEDEKASLFKILRQQCRTNFGKSALIKSDKRTTEWYLLSRMFRHSDRRQASSDAKILKFAHAEGIKENTFSSWVKRYKTLSNILKIIPNDNHSDGPKAKKGATTKPRYELVDRTNIPETEPHTALEAIKKLADGKVYQIYIFNYSGRFEIVRYRIAAPIVPPNTADEKDVADPNSKVAPKI